MVSLASSPDSTEPSLHRPNVNVLCTHHICIITQCTLLQSLGIIFTRIKTAHLKPAGTGDTTTLTFSSPVPPAGPNATLGSKPPPLLLLPPLLLAPAGEEERGRGSSDTSCSMRLAARYSRVWSPNQEDGYTNSGRRTKEM